MEPQILLLLLPLSSLLLLPAAAICLPRNVSHLIHAQPSSPPPPPLQSLIAPQDIGSRAVSSIIDPTLPGICAHTYGPDLCVSSIQSLGPALGPVDPPSVFKLQIKACATKTQAVRDIARKLMDETTDGQMKNNLDACISGYDDVLDSLDEALTAALNRDRYTLSSMLDSTSASFDQCTDEFMGPGPNPMAQYKDDLRQMAMNAKSISKLFI